MCANCFTHVDAVALSAVGITTGASAGYHRVAGRWSEATRRRRDRAVEYTQQFLENGPPQSGHDTAALLYVPVLVAYVILGLTTKIWVLNWIVGPLFPLLVLGVVPGVVQRIPGPRTPWGSGG